MVSIIDERVERNTGKAFVVKKDHFVKVIGETTVDFVAFNIRNLKERFDQARTKVNQGKIFISTGDTLYSRSSKPMFTIIEDTFKEGHHDLQKGMCSGESYRVIFTQRDPTKVYAQLYELKIDQNIKELLPDHGCWENLSEALKPWDISPEDIPSPLNIFQNMKIDGETGKMEFSDIRAKPGTYMILKAEMDCLVAVSACPDVTVGKSIQLQVYT